MKWWIPLSGAVAVSLLMASCSKLSTSSEENTSDESVPIPSTPVPASTPPSSEAIAAAAPTPAPKRLAPDGTFFLLAKKSMETDAGIVGLSPGTRVTRRADGKFLADGSVLELKPNEMTNDLDLAGRAAGADAQAQAAIRQTLAARATAANTGNDVPSSRTTAPAPAVSSGNAAPPSTNPPRSSLSGSGALGSAHSMTKGGWLWEKNPEGVWERVRPLR